MAAGAAPHRFMQASSRVRHSLFFKLCSSSPQASLSLRMPIAIRSCKGILKFAPSLNRWGSLALYSWARDEGLQSAGVVTSTSPPCGLGTSGICAPQGFDTTAGMAQGNRCRQDCLEGTLVDSRTLVDGSAENGELACGGVSEDIVEGPSISAEDELEGSAIDTEEVVEWRDTEPQGDTATAVGDAPVEEGEYCFMEEGENSGQRLPLRSENGIGDTMPMGDYQNWTAVADFRTLPDDVEGMDVDEFSDGNGSEEIQEDQEISGHRHLLSLDEVKEVLENVRARDIQVLAVGDRCEWTNFMVLATGISDRHVRGIADALVYKVKKKPYTEPTQYPTIEGREGGKWLAVDCGDIVIHVLDKESRAYYNLEELWSAEKKFEGGDQELEKRLRTAGLMTSIHPVLPQSSEVK